MSRVPTPADPIDLQRLMTALSELTRAETVTRLPVIAPACGGSRPREVSLDLIPAWKPELHEAELANNESVQRDLDRRASVALHREVDIPKWRRLTRRQMALAVERVLNTESSDLPIGRTVELTNPLGRSLEYVRTPQGWERLRALPELQTVA
jgi:hypothetical protein